MTQWYAHLRDEIFKRTADFAGDIIKEIGGGCKKCHQNQMSKES